MNSATGDITRFRPLIYAAVSKVAGNQVARDEVDDLIQDVYVELLEDKLARFDPERGMELTTYVTMVATRHIIDKMRKLRKMVSFDDTGPAAKTSKLGTKDKDATVGEWLDAETAKERHVDALEQMVLHEHSTRLQAAIDELPKGDQKFLARLMEDGYSTETHARELGITANAVYVKKCRLVNRLRKQLRSE